MAKSKGQEGDVLTTQNDEEKSVDAQINEVGLDAPTVERPQAEEPADSDGGKKSSKKTTAPPKPAPKRDTLDDLKVAVRALASRVMGPNDYADFLKAFPDLFEE